MYIAIVGNIGSGKTTLTDLLAKYYRCEAQFETVDDNPYLEDFYKDMRRWSFNLQIFFLKNRFKQQLDLQENKRSLIQDRTIYEDAYIFANNLHDMGLMTTRDYGNYLSLFSSLLRFIQAPDLLIYLRASEATLMDNIRHRGRQYEMSIRMDYLSKLNEKYEKWIENYQDGRLLIIDKDKINFANNTDHLNLVTKSIDQALTKVLPNPDTDLQPDRLQI